MRSRSHVARLVTDSVRCALHTLPPLCSRITFQLQDAAGNVVTSYAGGELYTLTVCAWRRGAWARRGRSE